MSGWLTNGVAQLVTVPATATLNMDTNLTGGQSPESGAVGITQLALVISQLLNTPAAGKTMVAGTRYYTSFTIGQAQLLTGIQVLVGGTGGTNNWYVELHDSAGVFIIQSAATLAGTASTWQSIPFTAPYFAQPGTYFLTLISNGTTATFATYNAAGLTGILTGSTSGGTAGTAANFTAPTTYTSNVGPQALPY